MTHRDSLAMERTRLANERTFLAYFRSFIVILSSGVAVLKISALGEIHGLGIFLVCIAPLLFLVGLVRFIYVKRKLARFFYLNETSEISK